jgi:hypothetical protein
MEGFRWLRGTVPPSSVVVHLRILGRRARSAPIPDDPNTQDIEPVALGKHPGFKEPAEAPGGAKWEFDRRYPPRSAAEIDGG